MPHSREFRARISRGARHGPVTVWSAVVFRSRQTLYLGVCPRLLYFLSVLGKYGYVTCEIYIKCGVFLYVYTDCGLVSLARLRPVRGRRTRIKYVIGLKGSAEAFCHSWYQSKCFVYVEISGMDDRRDLGGGGDDPEESTQHMTERIWESLTDIRARMDQQAPVPPVAVPPRDGETVPVAPVPPRVETVEEAAQRAATLERSIRTRQVGESGSGSFRLLQQSVGASKGKAPVGPSSSGFGKWGQKLKQAFKGKGRGWGGRQQFQQGRGRPEVEESQQSTTKQPITPPGYKCYNCNQPGHLICNCPYPREYGYGRGVQQQ
ncbi:hypothetical protein Taro_018582 [Colocasia esculenta]|uniref:CCHC-type domain-containing protein n=1 Tax=Colocasia esculenta TaxID=4460 RepID=A0A843UR44_COLES|nr:hypothetical protein [Colocasia esculenta]